MMNSRKTAVGIAVLFPLALTAFSAASASAAGSTAFTCVSDSVNGTLFGPHCLKTSTGDNTKYKHFAFTNETTGTATNANTATGTTTAAVSIFKGVILTMVTTVQCTVVHGEGPLSNQEVGGEMIAHTEVMLHFSGCTVTAPAGKGCAVGNAGKISTSNLTGRTVGEGENPRVSIKPKTEGANFAEIKIEGCSIAVLNGTWPISGTVELETNGATLVSTHEKTTNLKTLKFAGQNAGLEGALTLKAHEKAGEETKPISITATP